jgi:hypothetical protein
MATKNQTPKTPNKYGMSFALILSGMLLFGVLTLWNVSQARVESRDEKRAEERRALLAETQAASEELVHGAAWIDKEKGIARIPVADAAGLAVTTLAAKPVVSSTVSVAAALAAPADGATPSAPGNDAGADSTAPAAPAANGTAETPSIDTSQTPQLPDASTPPNPSEMADPSQTAPSNLPESTGTAGSNVN